MSGRNVVAAAKTLKKEALEKYSMNSIEAIVNQVHNGKNAMPAFKNRLNDKQIEDVAAYVLEQAEKGWIWSINFATLTGAFTIYLKLDSALEAGSVCFSNQWCEHASTNLFLLLVLPSHFSIACLWWHQQNRYRVLSPKLRRKTSSSGG